MASYYSEGGIDYTYDSRGNLVPITPEPVYTPPTPVVPDAIASNSTFQSINAATGGQLAELYSDIKQGNTNYYIGQYNEPTITLGSTGREITMTPTSTPGVYLAGLNTGGGGYTVPVKVDSKGNVSIADTAVTNANNINYVSNPSGGFFSGLAENLKIAAPYLAAGYLGTQVLPGLLSGAGAGGASAAALDAEFIAADALQLAGQGLAPAAIEQNLIAAGVDSLVAADAAQLALQGIGQGQLANLLVQSGGGGAGTLFTGAGLAGTAGGAGAAGAATQAGTSTGSATGAGAAGAAGSALTGSALAKLAGGLLAGGALTGGMGGGGNVTLPTPSNRAGVSTGSADFSPEYYQQLQQYYNAYMPTQPKDVATPLQKWYETKFTPDAGVTNKLFGV